MSIFNQFPWTNYREYNLDWVIRTVKDCKDTVDAALADVSNAVATYFADHIDTTLTQAGEAADAAVVGSRFNTINGTLNNVALSLGGMNTRLTNVENNLGHKYIFTMESNVLVLNNLPGMTLRETADALISDATNNTVFTVLFNSSTSYERCYNVHVTNLNLSSDDMLYFETDQDVYAYNLTQATESYVYKKRILIRGDAMVFVPPQGNFNSLRYWVSNKPVNHITIMVEENSENVMYPITKIWKESGDTGSVHVYYGSPLVHLICDSSDNITLGA